MTREEILEMGAGPELDALVGSFLFGYEIEWHWCWCEPECGCWDEVESIHNDEGKWVNELIESHKGWGEDRVKKLPCYSITNESEGQIYKFWNPVEFYSTDISATLQVIEELKKDWSCIQLIWDVGAWDIVLESYVRAKTFCLGKEAGETYEDLPEAVCKTALLTKLKAKNG